MPRVYKLKQNDNPKYFLSWGLGVQSTTLGVMLALGEFNLNKPLAIITADTKFEHSYTYKLRDFYTKYFNEHNINVEIVNNGDASDYKKNQLLPLWTDKGAPLKRQCTGEYKIVPIRRKMRELIGVSAKNGGRTLPGSIILYLGISYDEFERMKDSDRNYITNTYPLVDLKITRQDCIEYLKSKNLPVPIKSCCINCPYQGAQQWKLIKDNYPEDFKKAVEYDRSIRIPPKAMVDRGLYSGSLYVWKKSKPLEEENFDELVEERTDICDSGYCFI